MSAEKNFKNKIKDQGRKALKAFKSSLFPQDYEFLHDFQMRENKRELNFLFSASLVLQAVFLIVEAMGYRAESFPSTIMLLVLTVILFLVCTISRTRSDEERNETLWLYISCAGLSIIATAGDTWFTPDSSCFTLLCYLIIIPIVITDFPARLAAFQSCLTLFAIIAVCAAKSGNGLLMQMDILRILAASLVSMDLGCRRVNRFLAILHMNTTIQDSAEHDALTGIYNRAGGELLIRNEIELRHSGSFFMLDVDNFKHVNDHYGHLIGDRTLRQVADILQVSFRSSDIVMRMGGDEFIIYALGMVDEKNVRTHLEQMCKRMHTIVLDEATGDHVSISVGCVINDGTYPDYHSLYTAADKILYERKEAGKDGYKILNISYRKK